MISADVKTDAKQQEIKKEMVAMSCNFFKEVSLKLEIKCKTGVYSPL